MTKSTERMQVEDNIIQAIKDIVYGPTKKDYVNGIAGKVDGVESVCIDLNAMDGEELWELDELKNQDVSAFMAYGSPLFFCTLYHHDHQENTYVLRLGRVGMAIEYSITLAENWEEFYEDNQGRLF